MNISRSKDSIGADWLGSYDILSRGASIEGETSIDAGIVVVGTYIEVGKAQREVQ